MSELKEFIATCLVEICEGIDTAKLELKKKNSRHTILPIGSEKMKLNGCPSCFIKPEIETFSPLLLKLFKDKPTFRFFVSIIFCPNVNCTLPILVGEKKDIIKKWNSGVENY